MDMLRPFAVPKEWRFVDPDTGYKYLPCKSRQELIQRVLAYRSQNKLEPLEYLETTIEGYLCGLPENHSKCKPNNRIPRTVGMIVKGGIALLKNVFLGEENMVTQEVADERARICSGCPHNIVPEAYKDKLGALREWLDWVAVASTKGKKTPYDDKLNVCGICTCPLVSRVWSKQVDKDLEKYPSHCWKVKESK